MEEKRLTKIIAFMKEFNWPYHYAEEDDLGSIDFEYRGVPYHIWEFCEDGEWGVETNVRSGGHQEDLTGDYEEELLDIIFHWEGMEKYR